MAHDVRIDIIDIPMDYYYKGYPNGCLCLRKDINDGTITILTECGELIYRVTSGYGLEKVLRDLREGKYA